MFASAYVGDRDGGAAPYNALATPALPNAIKSAAVSIATPVQEKTEPVPQGRLKVAQDEILG
jgi:hypothetical protein